jgi:hypothetical protein
MAGEPGGSTIFDVSAFLGRPKFERLSRPDLRAVHAGHDGRRHAMVEGRTVTGN